MQLKSVHAGTRSALRATFQCNLLAMDDYAQCLNHRVDRFAGKPRSNGLDDPCRRSPVVQTPRCRAANIDLWDRL